MVVVIVIIGSSYQIAEGALSKAFGDWLVKEFEGEIIVYKAIGFLSYLFLH
jgi:hypothetical protein